MTAPAPPPALERPIGLNISERYRTAILGANAARLLDLGELS